VKQIEVPSVTAGPITSQNASPVAKTAANPVIPANNHSSMPAVNAQTPMQRCAGNHRSANCPAANGPTKPPSACVAEIQPTSTGLNPSFCKYKLSTGKYAPIGAYCRNISTDNRHRRLMEFQISDCR